MNIFSRAIAKAASLFPRVVQNSLPMGTLEFMKRWGKDPEVSPEALVRKYWGWNYSCAMLSATRFASTPLKLYAARGKGEGKVRNFATKSVDREQTAWIRKRLAKSLENVANAEDFEEITEHPLIELLRNVNDQENGYELKELTSTMLDLTGDAYWYIERDKLRVPSRLFVLRSQWVRILPDRDKFIVGYLYGVNGAFGGGDRLEIPAESVIHFKYPNPMDPWYGFGPTRAAGFTLEADELRQRFIIATLTNMGRPDLIVKYLEGELDPAERQVLEREWNATFKGSKNSGKVKVTDFRYEIDKIGWNPQELDFYKGEADILTRICSAYPVPVGLVDTRQISRAPRAGMEGSDLFMAQFNTLPRCTRVEEKLNEQFCPMYDGRLFLAFDNPVPKDKREQLNEDTTKLSTCVITVNEVRQRDGEEPVPWGDTPILLQQQQAAAQQFAPLGSASQVSPEAGASTNNIPGKPGTQANSTQENEGGSPGGALFRKKGGPGSGNFGHQGGEGGPGNPGGSGRGGGSSLRYDPSTNSHNGKKLIPGDLMKDDTGRIWMLDRNSGYILEATLIKDGKPSNRSVSFSVDPTDKDAFLDVRPMGRNYWWEETSGLNREGELGRPQLSKSLSDSMSMEVEGEYVHPTLAGIPIRLRVRNEAGRFDRRGVGRLRASREVVEALKA